MHTNGKRDQALLRVTCVLTGLLLFSGGVPAQTGSKTPPHPDEPLTVDKNSPSDNGPPLTTYEEEMRAKRLIKIAEKEHQQTISRAREISQLAQELQDSFKKRNRLDSEDTKRLDRIEKLTKKIRGEAGGGDDEVPIEHRPTDLASTLSRMGEVTEGLSKSVQSTPRQVVSAAVIGNANVLLELIRMTRDFGR